MTMNRRPATVLLPVMLTLALSGCAFFDPWAFPRPMHEFGSSVFMLDGDEQSREVTSFICPALVDCDRAVESDRIRIVRFTDSAAASTYAEYLDEAGYHSGRFVIEYRDDATAIDDRRRIEATMDAVARSSRFR